MHILQLGKYYYPDYGGMERAVKDISEGLLDKGHKVTVIASHNEKKLIREVINGVTVYRWPTWGKVLSQPLSVLSHSFIEKVNPDVIHLHLPNPLSLWTLKTERPVVVTYHADYCSESFMIEKMYYKNLNHQLEKKVNGVIFTSPHLYENNKITKKTLHNKYVDVIPFGVKSNGLSKAEPNDYRWDLIFVGRLVEYKGLSYLLKALQKTKNHLLIVGSGPLKSSLIQLTKELNLQEQVEFIGEKFGDELTNLYLKSKVAVLPSVNSSEAFGYHILDALSLGRALLTTDLKTGVNYVNQEGVTGLTARPKSVESLINIIEKIFSSEEKLLEFSENACRRVNQLFDMEKMLKSHISHYQKVLNSKGRELE